MSAAQSTLLLVLPVPLREDDDGRLRLERQACNGIARWAEHFARIILACPVHVQRDDSTDEPDDLPIESLACAHRIECVPLRARAGTLGFHLDRPRMRRLLSSAIERTDYLCFAIGGYVGDWGAVAALEAIRLGRPYAVWTDRVEHRVARTSHRDATGWRRAARFVRDTLIYSPLMRGLERRVIAHSHLGLFHGRECFDAYAPLARAPHLVHNIHLKASDRIGASALEAKRKRVLFGRGLRIVYAGRAAAMKGPDDWLAALSALAQRGVDFEACWLGDGPLLGAMAEEVRRLGLEDKVRLAGFVSDRAVVLDALREADVFMFCHKTPESPRCLIEALMSGTPIVGYHSAYPEDLLGEHAPALLTRAHDPLELAARIAELDAARVCFAERVVDCARRGEAFSDEATFRHRAELIRRYLPARPQARPTFSARASGTPA